MGQVKSCPIFQSSLLPPAATAPGVIPLVALPQIQAPGTPPSPFLAPAGPAKGVSLTANVTNPAGETARGILLAPGLDPVYLMAVAFGILPDAPASASDPNQINTYVAQALQMQLGPNDPQVTKSQTAGPRPGYSHGIIYFKIDHSPVTFSIPPEEMVDVDGTPIVAVVFSFPSVGDFYITPASVVLQDGQNETMSFTVQTAGANMGSRIQGRYPLRNIRNAW